MRRGRRLSGAGARGHVVVARLVALPNSRYNRCFNIQSPLTLTASSFSTSQTSKVDLHPGAANHSCPIPFVWTFRERT